MENTNAFYGVAKMPDLSKKVGKAGVIIGER